MALEAIIGLEVHAQLLTRSKMFCRCSTDPSAGPNTIVCPICTSMPGVLPVINRRAVELVVRTGLALNCSIAPHSIFARKNYWYPDLPKNYQISQYELPLCRDGYLDIDVNGEKRRVRIRRVHLEEDTGKLYHTAANESRVDFNRCGVPLMEIVSEPDMHSADEAREYLVALRQVLRYIGVCTGNMEEGSFRCEPNVNVRDTESDARTGISELKNLNSFRAVHQSVDFEIARHAKLLERGETVPRQTRRWHPSDESHGGYTDVMRSKEEAHDYRYFPEPDLVPMRVGEDWLAEIRAGMPELPQQKRDRFVSAYGLTPYDAGVLTQSHEFAEYFEATVAACPAGDASEAAKRVSKWLQGEMSRLLNETGQDIADVPVRPTHVAELLQLVEDGKLTGTIAKEVFEEMFRTGKPAPQVVSERGIEVIGDASELERIVDQVLADNPEVVEKVKSGKAQSKGFLVGQVMKATRGQAVPQTVNEIIDRRLGL